YVLVDDKPRILAAVKEAWRDRVTTVLPRQGQFARDAKAYPPADLTVERIGDLLGHDLRELLSPEVAASTRAVPDRQWQAASSRRAARRSDPLPCRTASTSASSRDTPPAWSCCCSTRQTTREPPAWSASIPRPTARTTTGTSSFPACDPDSSTPTGPRVPSIRRAACASIPARSSSIPTAAASWFPTPTIAAPRASRATTRARR